MDALPHGIIERQRRDRDEDKVVARDSGGARKRRRFGLLELSILAAAICVSGAIITLAIVGATSG